MTDEALAAIAESLARLARVDESLAKRLGQSISANAKLTQRVAFLRGAIKAVQVATTEGRVCDDVAWFDQITTLHDFCEQTLDADDEMQRRSQ
jgi:hypothetical protein